MAKYLRYLEFDRSFESCAIDAKREQLASHLIHILNTILLEYPPTNENAEVDFTVFSGTGGLVLVYLKLKRLLIDCNQSNNSTNASLTLSTQQQEQQQQQQQQQQQFLSRETLLRYLSSFAQYLPLSLAGVRASRGKFAGREMTYLCGPPGIWLYTYQYYASCCRDARLCNNDDDKGASTNLDYAEKEVPNADKGDDDVVVENEYRAVSRRCVAALVEMFPRVLSGHGLTSVDSDIFYGRVGYLMAALSVWRLQEGMAEVTESETVTEVMLVALGMPVKG
jgi:hypothetical protein